MTCLRIKGPGGTPIMLCSEIEKTRPDLDCPNADQHTPHPAGYIQHSDWAESMLKTHRQQRCKGCGKWNIWTPRASPAPIPVQAPPEARHDPGRPQRRNNALAQF